MTTMSLLSKLNVLYLEPRVKDDQLESKLTLFSFELSELENKCIASLLFRKTFQ